jgi:hypothetical protein
MKERCHKRIFSGGYIGHPCPNQGKVERDGHWYCKKHDPVEVKKRDDARNAKWKAEWDAKRAARDHQQAIRNATDSLVSAAKFWANIYDQPLESVNLELLEKVRALQILERKSV